MSSYLSSTIPSTYKQEDDRYENLYCPSTHVKHDHRTAWKSYFATSISFRSIRWESIWKPQPSHQTDYGRTFFATHVWMHISNKNESNSWSVGLRQSSVCLQNNVYGKRVNGLEYLVEKDHELSWVVEMFNELSPLSTSPKLCVRHLLSRLLPWFVGRDGDYEINWCFSADAKFELRMNHAFGDKHFAVMAWLVCLCDPSKYTRPALHTCRLSNL